ncbi:MAG TPA: GntR family transcriptional regulator [Gemmatimonadales bacterium]
MPSRAKPASRSTQRPQRVYEELRALIVRGRLAPGSRLVETEIAQRFHVSRTPVRGALQRLQQEGYILDSLGMRQSRPTIAPLTREDSTELFEIVGQIEGLAARRAAQLADRARGALAARMAEVNRRFRRAAESPRPDHNRLFELDEQFHQRYVEAAAGPRLRALHQAVKPQAERYERLYVTFLVGEIMTSVREHDAIVSAIEAGRPAAAEQAVVTNWQNAAQRLSQVIERAGELGRW